MAAERFHELLDDLHDILRPAGRKNGGPMDPDDVPTEITKLVYTLPLSTSQAFSQNQAAALLAHFWPAIEKHVREQVAAEIEAVDPADWALAGQHAGQDAARIARGINPNT